MFDVRTYGIWRGMVQRCINPKHVSFKWYGAKGVTVCGSWRDSYHAFLSDMGIATEGRGIDRRDNALGYSLENCRWSTTKEQNNNKSDTRLISIDGITKNMSAWALAKGLSPQVVHYRLTKLGMTPIDAITTPNMRRKIK